MIAPDSTLSSREKTKARRNPRGASGVASQCESQNGCASVLVVDDKEQMRAVLEKFLNAEGYAVESAASADEALRKLEKSNFDLVLSDIKMPGMDGNELLDRVRARNDETIVILMTAFGSIEAAVSAIKRGAADYVSKPFAVEEVLLRIRRALDERGLKRRVAALEREVAAQRETNAIIGQSAPIKRLRQIIARVAPLDDTVLITGETGTGKELIARALHAERERARNSKSKNERPFIALDCSAIPETLIEAELFGFERGAFTGATETRAGLFETAADGTFFLDEVETLAPAVQVKLLRVLQERAARRIGGRRDFQVRARIVAATNRDLAQMVKQRTFREDLYYRISVIPVHAPPLRERREDIAELVSHILARRAAERNAPPARVTPEALQRLVNYNFPGNVRELENALSYALALGGAVDAAHGEKETIIGVEDLPPHIAGASINDNVSEDEFAPLPLDEIERRHIARTLAYVGGNQVRAAKLLGIDRRTLYNKLQQWKER